MVLLLNIALFTEYDDIASVVTGNIAISSILY